MNNKGNSKLAMRIRSVVLNKKVISGLVAVFLGFFVGMLLAFFLGIKTEDGFQTYMPQDILAPMIKAFSGIDIFDPSAAYSFRDVGEMLVSAMPLILCGLSVGFAFKTGLFNIGSEGQLMMGSLAATLCGLYLNLPPVIHAIVCLIAGGLAGFAFGVIPGYLKARFNVHEVVTCIMLNYAAMYFADMIYRLVPGFYQDQTPPVKESALIKSDFLTSITDGSRLNWGIIVVIISIIVYYIIINKTTFGYQLKAIGSNKDAAEYSGMNVKRGIVMSMGISGVFAGLAGAILVLGVFGYGRVLTSFESYGYDGIAVSLVGANSAVGILFSGILFAVLSTAQPLMEAASIPKDIAVIISALIILFCAIPLLYERYIDKFLKRREERKKSKMASKPKKANDSGGEV